MMKEFGKEVDFFTSQHRLWSIMNAYTEYILNAEELKRFIEEDNSKFDLVIAEEFFQQIFYVFSYKYRAPLILLSTFGVGHYMNEYMGNSMEISYVPHEFFAVSGDMTVFDRLKNLAYTLYDILARRYYSLAFQNELAKSVFKNLGEIPNLEELERNASLLLINAHYSTSIVRPYVPNIVEIGGIHMDAVKNLDEDLRRLLDEAKDGAVLFSFGSVMDLSRQPRESIAEVLAALGSIAQTVILKWNSDEPLPILYGNIHPYKWIPQNDVLAHPNLRAFVTHGGLHSAMEAIHHGVPTICVPFFGDQPLNCLKSAKMGWGIALEKKNLDQNVLRTALNEILHMKSYQNRARELSVVFKDRPIDVMNSTMFWIEYASLFAVGCFPSEEVKMSISHTLAPVRVGSVGLKPTKKVPLKMKWLDRLCYVVGRLYNFTESGRTTHVGADGA
ncbi:UDP-glucuronosyltransferase 2B4 [Eumeta japonica]|uniref:UDP-glucuronosyltransferase n=1 Tax=Eumeta variegata TaxID=151549 RepID=A0A4C1Z7B8_EUMVA|nr:UDP-glucuronosyltransferase 2B4 [Eumeta japonica]